MRCDLISWVVCGGVERVIYGLSLFLNFLRKNGDGGLAVG